ncbi:adenosylmethionine--8-amino-7-oxononanoate transaminase [Thiomonas sp. FB-Cd]|uniref:adenosylmethionine--8-amino-7-oxononanoate transaminase n=1 Tax=Thiomonas sp. FB-Cd TaxID=1158292 RepID=UPI00068F7DE7|nr:adenosylmethionine--8-amino-7-oxononanoate transaminase [Thiomonas sp. FB-Cd]
MDKPLPAALDIPARSLRAVWHPCTQMKRHEQAPPLEIVSGEGVWLTDAKGRRVVDAISSWWVNLFGHNQPSIKAAIRAQMDRVEHVMLAGLTHAPVVQLSEALAARTGLSHAHYGSDGSSATEIALKLSAHYWRNVGRPEKNRFIGLAGGYHGETVGALSVTDIPLFRANYGPLLRVSATVPVPDARARPTGMEQSQWVAHCVRALEAHLEVHAHETAALIVEPLVQCAAGFVMIAPQYLTRARELCTHFDVHLVADEIAVGMGRTGTFLACEQAGVRPDFVCLSKGLTGGYLPLSVVLTTDSIYHAFYDDDVALGFLHSHSYTGNPLACSAALATLALLNDAQLIANSERATILDAVFAPLTAHPRLIHARRLGMIWAWDVDGAPADFARHFAAAALKRGALLRPIGNTIYFMPPYVIDDDAATLLRDAALGALATVLTTATHPQASSPPLP